MDGHVTEDAAAALDVLERRPGRGRVISTRVVPHYMRERVISNKRTSGSPLYCGRPHAVAGRTRGGSVRSAGAALCGSVYRCSIGVWLQRTYSGYLQWVAGLEWVPQGSRGAWSRLGVAAAELDEDGLAHLVRVEGLGLGFRVG